MWPLQKIDWEPVFRPYFPTIISEHKKCLRARMRKDNLVVVVSIRKLYEWIVNFNIRNPNSSSRSRYSYKKTPRSPCISMCICLTHRFFHIGSKRVFNAEHSVQRQVALDFLIIQSHAGQYSTLQCSTGVKEGEKKVGREIRKEVGRERRKEGRK